MKTWGCDDIGLKELSFKKKTGEEEAVEREEGRYIAVERTGGLRGR